MRKLRIALIVLLLLGVAGFAWLWFAPCGFGGCAPVSDLEQFQAEGSELLDMNGDPMGRLATVNRRVVPLDSLPPLLPQAFLAVEDRRFYEHGGVDWKRMVGALRTVVTPGQHAEGGSTITMQLARNLFPDRLSYKDRTPRRKLMEMRVARQIERAFPKDKIFELYLNHIYLGEGAYGVEAAAREYFGKPAAELTLPEAAMIAGIPKAPSQLNPRADREAALARRDLVLDEMAQAGFVTAEQAAEAKATPLKLARASHGGEGKPSSYFTERVRRELEEIIGDRFYTAGMRVYTTLDPVAQRAAEAELAQRLDAIEAGRFGAYRHPTYPEARGAAAGDGSPYLQGVVVVMDAQTGAVRALVGGRDFQDSNFDRAFQALRQPGSAFKPFVYLTALERYRSPVYTVEDSPLRLTLSGGQVWEPKNYTGSFEGSMTLRDALARSKNVPTVRLAQDLGMAPILGRARELGITSELPDVPAAALGAAEVKPIDLTVAYAAFANGGQRVRPGFVRRIESRGGEVLWEARPEAERVLDAPTAFVLTSMLRDVVDRGTGTAVRTAGFRGPAAGKTGTTNDATDVWFVGYTPELVGTVWIGLDKPATIVRGASGGTLAAPVWGRIMQRIYRDRPTPRDWRTPAGVVTEQVERGTGRVVDEFCPARGETYTEYFLGVRPPQTPCATTQYPTMVYADSGWVDEEWSVDPPTATTAGQGEVAPGIVWPELEARRHGAPSRGAAPEPLPLPRSMEEITTPSPPRVPTAPAPRPLEPSPPTPQPLPATPPNTPAERPAPRPEPAPLPPVPAPEPEIRLPGVPVLPAVPPDTTRRG